MDDLLVTKTITKVDYVATGAAMRRHRVQAGVSLRKLARRMGISAAFLSDLELGRRAWSLPRAIAYIEALAQKP